jgi:hypothetical protein
MTIDRNLPVQKYMDEQTAGDGKCSRGKVVIEF